MFHLIKILIGSDQIQIASNDFLRNFSLFSVLSSLFSLQFAITRWSEIIKSIKFAILEFIRTRVQRQKNVNFPFFYQIFHQALSLFLTLILSINSILVCAHPHPISFHFLLSLFSEKEFLMFWCSENFCFSFQKFCLEPSKNFFTFEIFVCFPSRCWVVNVIKFNSP